MFCRSARVDPVGHAGKLLQACQLAAAVEQARDRQLVGGAADIGDAGAVADRAIAVVLRISGSEVDLLPAVTRGIEVGHVVAGGRQRTLEGEQGTGTGGKYAGHGVPQRRVIPSAAVAVLAKVWPRRVPASATALTARSMVGPPAIAAILAA
ncbi:hypothetical protein G6F57_018939 [Rhizopus arrhizus]|nr:hypothetical protein G6F57_018939 [Rhizopus arrhizus]